MPTNPNVQAVREALTKLLRNYDKWNFGNQADAYYCIAKDDAAWDAAHAALAMLPADGVIVPAEPTEAMLRAAKRCPVPRVDNVLRSEHELAAAIYRAMLAAAQDGGQ